MPETSPPFEQLFESAKQQALPGVWNLGVKLARSGKLEIDTQNKDEVVLRVPSPGRAVAPTAILYLEEGEWTCDCGSRNDPCEHAVAAVIALHQGLASQEQQPAKPAQLLYCLSIERQRLKVTRYWSSAQGRKELSESITTLVAHGLCPFIPTEDDIHVDRLLQAVPRGDFSLDQTARLLSSLSKLDVQFDGKPIRVRNAPLKPVARVTDEGEKIVLSIDPPPSLTRVLLPGIALCEDATELRPIGALEVAGLRMERLPLRRSLGVSETAELIDRILPDLSKSIEVDVQSSRLPARVRTLKPRIDFDLSHHGHTLSVLPTLVYGDPPVARIDGEHMVLLGNVAPRRNRSEEHALSEKLKDQLNLRFGRRVDFDGEAAARFVEHLRHFSSQEQTAGPALTQVSSLLPRVSLGARGFDVTFEASGNGNDHGKAEAQAVLKAYRDGLELVPLSNGGFGSIPHDWLVRFGDQIQMLLAARDARGDLPTCTVPALAKLAEAMGEAPPPEMRHLQPLFEGFQALPEAVLPADLTASLRPYQHEAVRWLTFLRTAKLGAVLADDMGLGKTLQTLCAITGKTLVVCPKSVLFNWEREVARFRPSLSCSVYHGPKRSLDETADIVLTSYAVLRLDIEQLSARTWDCVVLDEAQTIKNPGSQAAQAAFQLSADFKIALSGTPVENRLEELWSIVRFTHPGLLGSRSAFDEHYAKPIAAGDSAAVTRLRELVKPFLLRRLKSVVAKDLPPRSDIVLPIELEEPEQRLYDAVLATTKTEVVRELQQGGSVMRALEALLRLRQAACHGGLLPGQTAVSSSKTQALLDALVDVTESGHKALVFSQWTSFLDRIEPHLVDANIAFLRLDGSVRDRGRVVEQFQSTLGPPVLLASLKAGGTGLNLTAADHVFLMDPWYNPAAEDQAADRAHRIGQDRPVMVYKLVAKGTVEEGILELQEKKRSIADAALSGAEGATSITRDDLLSLLA